MARNPMGAAGDAVGRAAHGAAREAAPWVERLARLGYAARGVVYVIVGILAARAAFGSGGRVTGSRGALGEIVRQPFGKVMLGVVALGLVGFAVWRFVQAALDPEHKGADGKGAVTRVSYAISGVVHAALALTALRMLSGSGEGGGGREEWTARVMEAPAGRWLVALAGLVIAGYGVYQAYKAYKADLGKRLDLSRMQPDVRDGVVKAARAGMAARGVVFCIIGFFLVRAALSHDSSEARGLQGALEALRGAPYGPWLLGLVALGLIGYGIFEVVKSRYRRITPA